MFVRQHFLPSALRRGPHRIGVGLALLAVCFWTSAFAAQVPLPRPRPAEAPARDVAKDEAAGPEQGVQQAEAPKPPEPSACRLALTEAVAIAPSIPPIHAEHGCGGDDLVRLEAVVVSPSQRVALKPPAILRCTMATAIANWVRDDAAPLATKLGSVLSEIDNYDSYECRGRNRIVGAKLSEHGLANALDVRGLKLANGTMLSLTDRHLARETREAVLTSVCTRFMTVLGPGSDWYHEEHIHLDLAERRNNYKICQWGVYDPLPEIAPLMPEDRPAEAPPRPATVETADKTAAPQSASEEPPAEDTDKPAAADSAKSKSKTRSSRKPQ
ncbi:MAG: extensin family protein [Bradyrhizobiaceae bacterium]|nr:MAG: extensin family protein [Bradyrhizobiaceae bacterium]